MSLRSRRNPVMKKAEWDDCQPPARHHFIVKVLRSVGNDLYMVKTPSEEVYHVSMPIKFKGNVWVKRGDYVLVEPVPEGIKVKAEIVKIINKNNIKLYQENITWPKQFVYSKIVKEKDNNYDLFENLNKNRVSYYSDDDSETESESFEDSSDSDSGISSNDEDVVEY